MPSISLGLQQMPEVGPAVPAAGRAAAALLNGPIIQLVFGVQQVQLAVVGIYMAVASVAAGIYTVKEVDAPLHSLQNVGRGSHSP